MRTGPNGPVAHGTLTGTIGPMCTDRPESRDPANTDLFSDVAATGSSRAREILIERYAGLAVHIARRYRRPAVAEDDLRQVAMVGLVKAVDRFDPDRGVDFVSFAGRTIEGEIKRYFRDGSWQVRVPRSAKELHLRVRRGIEELSGTTGREPSVDDLAGHLGLDPDRIRTGLAAGAAYRPYDLDEARPVVAEDPVFERCLDRHLVGDLLRRLPERQRTIVSLRFFDDRTQREIADAVGVSQMRVSRLLRASIAQMRADLERDRADTCTADAV